jgi:hypothetical protein
MTDTRGRRVLVMWPDAEQTNAVISLRSNDGSGPDIGRLWRSTKPREVSPETLESLAERLSKTEILREPRWRAALRGDVPSAAAIAIDRLFAGEIDTSRIDLIMSCLLVLAAGGSPAATMLLDHGRRLVAAAETAC